MKQSDFKRMTKGLDVKESKTLTYVHFDEPKQVEELVSVLRAENIPYTRKNLGDNKGHISLRTREIDTFSDLASFIMKQPKSI